MFSKLVRIGRDASLRYTASGKPVIGLACVYDIGWGDNKKSQWLEVVIWGKQAEALAQYLTKGNQVVIHADDIELDEYQKKDGGQGAKLKCKAINIELTDSRRENQQQQQQQPQPQPQQQYNPRQPQPNPQQQQAQEFDNSFDSDLPF